MTLAAGPVAAQGITCVVASSFVSVATFKSRNPNVTDIRCASQNAEHWRTQAGLATPPPVLNQTVATFLGTTDSQFNLTLLRDVMLNGSGIQTAGEIGTLQHLVAMGLNLEAFLVPAPGSVNVAYLRGIWINYKANSNRYILPASNINWGDTELIAWLRYMMYPAALP